MRRYVLPLLTGFLLLIAAGVQADMGDSSDNPWNQQANPQQVTADYQAGYQALQAGDYKVAIKAFKRVLQANPQHAMAYTNMAYAYRKLGKYKKAIKLYKKALKLEPNLAEAHEYIGEAWLALGKIDKAKEHLNILEKLNPKLAGELRDEIARREQS